LVEVAADLPLGGSDHQVVSKVELSALVEEGPFEVRLEDVGAETAIAVGLLLLDVVLDFLESAAVVDVPAAIAELARLDYPAVGAFLALLVELPQELEILLVLKPSSDVEGHRQIAFRLFVAEICLHRAVQGFLIPNHSAKL
jgi:hypothetical protein